MVEVPDGSEKHPENSVDALQDAEARSLVEPAAAPTFSRVFVPLPFGRAARFASAAIRREQIPVWLILILSLLATFAVWHFVARDLQDRERRQFEALNTQIAHLIDEGFATYAQVMRGAAALHDIVSPVTREQWTAYANALDMDVHYPGLIGVGYAALIKEAEREGHLRDQRAAGFHDYKLKPDGVRPLYVAISYLTPETPENRTLIGLDLLGGAFGRAAMERARDTGRPALTARVAGTSDAAQSSQPVAHLYLPIYAKGRAIATIEQRREALIGYVFAPFRINGLLREVLARDSSRGLAVLRLEIYDGTEVGDSRRIFDSMPTGWTGTSPPRLVRSQPMDVFGHRWTLRFSSTPAFATLNDSGTPRLVTLIGGVFSLLAAAVAWAIQQRHTDSLAAAERVRRELAKRRQAEGYLKLNQTRLRLALRAGQMASWEFDAETGAMTWEELNSRSGQDAAQFNAGTLEALELIADPTVLGNFKRSLTEQLADPDCSAFSSECGLRDAAGNWRWLEFRGLIRRKEDGSARQILGVAIDITERKAAEEATNHSHRLFRALVDATAQIVWTTSADGMVVDDSPSWRAFTGQTLDQWKGNGWFDALHPEDRDRTERLWQQSVETLKPLETEYRIAHVSGDWRWTSVRAVPITDAQGALHGWVGMNVDITERKAAEVRESLLVGELKHRGKNLLAVIQSIVSRSVSGHRTLAEARELLLERLQAIARTYTTLTDRAWKGAPLSEIVRQELDAISERIDAQGPDILINSSGAQTFALVLHELATNAVKYGALSVPGGRIRIRWATTGTGTDARLTFSWHERDGPQVMPSTFKGFGTTLLARAFSSPSGEPARIELNPDGLSYDVEVMLSDFAAPGSGVAPLE